MRRNKNNEYYNLISASVGFQLGILARSIIIMFLNDTALGNFRNSDGWKVGIDGSIAIINLGIGANVDTDEISSAVVGMVIDHRGLMYNLTLEGSKITRISR